jgi:signal transduction histidine kinase
MSIKLRLGLLLGALLLGLLATLVWVRRAEQAERVSWLDAERDARSQLLGHWMEMTSRALPDLAAELSQSEDFARLVTQSDPARAREQIANALAPARASALWVVRDDGRPRLAATGDAPAALPLEPSEFTALVADTPNPRFFAEWGRQLVEVCVRRLRGVDSSAREWLVVARAWDEGQLRTLAALMDANVALRPPHDLAQPPADRGNIVLVRALADWRGHALRTLRIEQPVPETDLALQADWRQATLFFSFGLMLIAAVGLALQTWVLRPLGQIATSLATDRPEPALEVAREKSELGRVAQLVATSFAQREALRLEVEQRRRAAAALERSEAALRRNIEERARLGRDLHDGVIQSLYAAGMGLAGIRALLQPAQAEAIARLEQSRVALNETIHDVRNFIIGLEPESLKLQTFSQAVDALVDLMRGMGRFKVTLAIDDSLAASLSLAQRVHALQIAREAVSNALRHGAATEIHIALRPIEGDAEFLVRDNGRGFEPRAGMGNGHGGLTNFAARARELGGSLEVTSRPGEGTCVRLVFSALPPS